MMNELEHIQRVYLIGIGGIGMSALARYFRSRNLPVAGYDRMPTRLTDELIAEGCDIHFTDDLNRVDPSFRTPEGTLVIYTPAVPSTHAELSHFRQQEFQVMKRAEVLGLITRSSQAIAVAGTHGKTSVSSMIAHILHHSGQGCNAFLGGIMKNYQSNILISPESRLSVVEADEFDHSFLQLFPWMAVVTSCDPDHLDIYGNYQQLKKAFRSFAGQVNEGGFLLLNRKAGLQPDPGGRTTTYTYALSGNEDIRAGRITTAGGMPLFDIVLPGQSIRDIRLGVPGEINVENALAAAGAAWLSGITTEAIREALQTYTGVMRRFDIQLNTGSVVYIDDYAHHPEELRAFISSVRIMYPGKKLTGIFQPHLYSRTRDFAGEFAESLGLLDELIMLDIYPAREEPIEGVSSAIILDQVDLKDKILLRKDQLPGQIASGEFEVVLTMGAGDIDTLTATIKKILTDKTATDE